MNSVEHGPISHLFIPIKPDVKKKTFINLTEKILDPVLVNFIRIGPEFTINMKKFSLLPIFCSGEELSESSLNNCFTEYDNKILTLLTEINGYIHLDNQDNLNDLHNHDFLFINKKPLYLLNEIVQFLHENNHLVLIYMDLGGYLVLMKKLKSHHMFKNYIYLSEYASNSLTRLTASKLIQTLDTINSGLLSLKKMIRHEKYIASNSTLNNHLTIQLFEATTLYINVFLKYAIKDGKMFLTPAISNEQINPINQALYEIMWLTILKLVKLEPMRPLFTSFSKIRPTRLAKISFNKDFLFFHIQIDRAYEADPFNITETFKILIGNNFINDFRSVFNYDFLTTLLKLSKDTQGYIKINNKVYLTDKTYQINSALELTFFDFILQCHTVMWYKTNKFPTPRNIMLHNEDVIMYSNFKSCNSLKTYLEGKIPLNMTLKQSSLL